MRWFLLGCLVFLALGATFLQAQPLRVYADCNGVNKRLVMMISPNGYPDSFVRELYDMYKTLFVNMDPTTKFTVVVDYNSTKQAILSHIQGAPIQDPSRIHFLVTGQRSTVWARDFMVGLYNINDIKGGILSQTHLEGHNGDTYLGKVLADEHSLYYVRDTLLKTAGGDVLGHAKKGFIGIRSIKATAKQLSAKAYGDGSADAAIRAYEAATGLKVLQTKAGPDFGVRFVPHTFAPSDAPPANTDLSAVQAHPGALVDMVYDAPSRATRRPGVVPEATVWEKMALQRFQKQYNKPLTIVGADDPNTSYVEKPISFHIDMTCTPIDERTMVVASSKLGKELVYAMSSSERKRNNLEILREIGWYDIDPSNPWDVLGKTAGANDSGLEKDQESVVRLFKGLGYKVVRMPYLCSYGYVSSAKTPWFSYNNCIMENYKNGAGKVIKKVYLPVFCSSLDAAAKAVWEGLGFQVIPLKLGAVTAYFGAIRCTTNHLGKSQNEGYNDQTASPLPGRDLRDEAREARYDGLSD